MDVLLANIEAAYNTFVLEAEKNIKDGNKSAGARARKASVELGKLFKEYRNETIAKEKGE